MAGRALGALFAISNQGADLGGRLVLQMHEPNHDVGYLHARVVDVVLHVDLLACGAEQAHKGVAEDRVAQVAYVRSLVGIDRCVFYERVDTG